MNNMYSLFYFPYVVFDTPAAKISQFWCGYFYYIQYSACFEHNSINSDLQKTRLYM